MAFYNKWTVIFYMEHTYTSSKGRTIEDDFMLMCSPIILDTHHLQSKLCTLFTFLVTMFISGDCSPHWTRTHIHMVNAQIAVSSLAPMAMIAQKPDKIQSWAGYWLLEPKSILCTMQRDKKAGKGRAGIVSRHWKSFSWEATRIRKGLNLGFILLPQHASCIILGSYFTFLNLGFFISKAGVIIVPKVLRPVY